MPNQSIEALYKKVQRFAPYTATDVQERDEQLQTDAADEARQPSVSVTPTGFTPGMSRTCTEPTKKDLLEWIQVRNGFLELAEPNIANLQQQIESVESKRKEQSHPEYLQRSDAAIEREQRDGPYKHAKDAKDDTGRDYERIKRQHDNREATTFPVPLYLFGLFGLGVAEWFINYSTFRGAYGIPIVAIGFTIVFAAGFAFASHFHGTYIRQYDHRFGRQAERRSSLATFVLVFFSCIVVIGLLFVAYSRFAWTMDQIQATTSNNDDSPFSQLGGTQDSQVALKVFMSVAANVLVWLVGVGMAWLVHDEDPDFAMKKRRMIKARRIFRSEEGRVNSAIRSAKAARDADLARIGALLDELRRQLATLRSYRDTVIDKDHQILSAIEKQISDDASLYKNHFCNSALNNPSLPTIQMSGGPITIEQYQELDIQVNLRDLSPGIELDSNSHQGDPRR